LNSSKPASFRAAVRAACLPIPRRTRIHRQFAPLHAGQSCGPEATPREQGPCPSIGEGLPGPACRSRRFLFLSCYFLSCYPHAGSLPRTSGRCIIFAVSSCSVFTRAHGQARSSMQRGTGDREDRGSTSSAASSIVMGKVPVKRTSASRPSKYPRDCWPICAAGTDQI
jgi:hypothetical protein